MHLAYLKKKRFKAIRILEIPLGSAAICPPSPVHAGRRLKWDQNPRGDYQQMTPVALRAFRVREAFLGTDFTQPRNSM